ncbi:MAG: 50S ribosomal protein L31 [Candidatus Gracilibacteria bacterium]
MKKDIHPKYYQDAKISCANCSAKFDYGTTKEEVRIETCSQCHPFFTGKNVLMDTEGRIDKFRQKMSGAVQREKKTRNKKTLEERVNEEISSQIAKEKAKEA